MSSGKASSLIHYRFKSSLNYSFVNFDGVSVSVAELKQLIVQKEKLTRLEEFDLQIVDAHSKRGILYVLLILSCLKLIFYYL